MYAGMGDGTAIATEGVIGSTVATVATGTSIFGTVAAGSLAIPLIGAGIAAVTAIIGIFMAKNAQYHAQETATTQIVDQAEQLMKQNLAAWNASSKTQSEQAQAEQNFQNIWQQVVNACNQQQFGDPGQRCIHDRERGGQWPWPVYYLDPISEDPDVQPDPAQGVVGSLESALSGEGSRLPLLLMGGLVLLAVAS